MQKLVFTNANGISVELTKHPYGITKWGGFSNTGLEIQSQTVPFNDGSVFLDALMKERELSVTLAMDDENDLEKRYQLRRELISVLNPKLGEGILIYTNDFMSKQIKVVPKIPIFETKNSNTKGSPKASLAWTACNPYWEDLEETTIYLKNSIRTLVENKGDVPCQIKVDLMSNNVTNPQIKSFTNNNKIKLNGTFNDFININTNIGKKEVNSKKFIFNTKGFSGGSIAYSESLGMFVMAGEFISNSKDGINWNFIIKLGQITSNISECLNSVVYSESLGMFVAVGEHKEIVEGQSVYTGIIYTSPDGINWTRQVENIENSLTNILWDKNIFVAIGKSEIIYTSPDGINWTKRNIENPETTIDLTKIYYIDSLEKFFILGYNPNASSLGVNSSLYISSNGIDWNKILISDSYKVGSLCYSDSLNLFIISDINFGNIFKSSDGITWSQETVFVQGATDIIWCKDLELFIILFKYQTSFSPVHYTSLIYTSPDGINWTERNNESGGLNSIIWCENLNLLISVGERISVSSDGINWENKFTPSKELSNVYYFFDMVIFISTMNSNSAAPYFLVTSSDGINWIEESSESYIELQSVTYSESLGLFVAVGSGNIYISSDGINWTEREKPTTDILNSVIYSESLGLFIAVGGREGESGGQETTDYVGALITSPDGINWTNKTNLLPTYTGTSKYLNSITYSESLGLFVAVGYVGVYQTSLVSERIILTSSNCITWDIRHSSEAYRLKSVIYSESLGLFIAVGNKGTILTSSNAVNWIKHTISSQDGLLSVTYSELLGLFVVVGGNIYTSPDGINWTKRVNGISNLQSVTYSELLGLFVAVGDGNIMFTSSDGINWTDDSIIGHYNSITFSEKLEMFVIVGYSDFGYSDFLDTENLINKLSSDSDMNLNLKVGKNEFLCSSESGKINAKLTYRQRYIGV